MSNLWAEFILRYLIFRESGENIVMKSEVRIARDMHLLVFFKLIEFEPEMIEIHLKLKYCSAGLGNLSTKNRFRDRFSA